MWQCTYHLASPVLAGILLLSACRANEAPVAREERGHAEEEKGHAEERLTLSGDAREAIALESVPVVRRPLRETLRATAVIKPNAYKLAHVSPRIAGKAIEVPALLGDHVKQGQILAQLDSLELGERKAAYLQAQTNLAVARRNYAREKRLFARHISSEKEYLEAKGEFERSEAAYRAAREALHLVGLSEAGIDTIRWEEAGQPLSHFPLLAPFAGTVVERHITIGELIRPEDKPFTIADLTAVWIVIDVYEKDLGRVRTGAAVDVAVDAYPGEVFSGTLTYVSNMVDPTTRTAEARVELANPDERLRPGMFATAEIFMSASDRRQALVVPHDAVQRIRGEPVVFVEEEPGTYSMREITVGRESDTETELLSGVAAGERVVAKGAFYLKSTLLKEEMVGHGD